MSSSKDRLMATFLCAKPSTPCWLPIVETYEPKEFKRAEQSFDISDVSLKSMDSRNRFRCVQIVLQCAEHIRVCVQAFVKISILFNKAHVRIE